MRISFENFLCYKQKKFDGATKRQDELVLLSGSSTYERILDKSTGFQTGHVSDYVDGSWKTILTTAQLR